MGVNEVNIMSGSSISVSNTHQFDTKQDLEVFDIGNEIRKEIQESGVTEGTCTISTPHTTAAIVVGNYLRMNQILYGLKTFFPEEKIRDMPEFSSEAPMEVGDPRLFWACFCSSLMGTSVTFPIINGQLELGAWSGIYLVELAGPRPRTVYQIIHGRKKSG